MTSTRRSDFDVTNSVQVSSPAAVLAAVEALYRPTWPGLSMEPLGRAFEHFERLFAGKVAGYHGVDTVYHDRQHTLDITLALARLIVGYERQQEESTRLGGARAVVGLVTGLFHDVGYLRRTDDKDSRNGAEFTRTHVSRGARFLQEYLPVLGFRSWVPVASEIIHYTGYEVPFERIVSAEELLAEQKRDDRLSTDQQDEHRQQGECACKRRSAQHQLPRLLRLEIHPHHLRIESYRYLEVLFGGGNPYMEAIERNVEYLRQVLRSESWQLLRRRPPIFAASNDAASNDPMATMRGLMLGHIKRVWSGN